MKTVGIIAEYNPFHNGHAYQLQAAKAAAQGNCTVIVMSPDFVQRGEPALVDKYCRARMALESGADLVLELPVCYSTGSAEYFAEGGISLLHKLGCVDTLSFGCENDTPELFSALSDILLQEPKLYKTSLQSYQKQGLTFPKARELALLEYLNSGSEQLSSIRSQHPASKLTTSVSELLSNPNNILGLEYCKALKKINSPITVLPIKRMGSSYHSLDFDQEFCSASAIRAKLNDSAAPEDLTDFLPGSSLSLLKEKLDTCQTVTLEDFSALLQYKLLSEAGQGFNRYLDVTSDLSDRIIKLLPQFQSSAQFISLLKTKQMTEARIRRTLLHILLNITREETEDYRSQGAVFYARVLGFRREAAPLLHKIKETSSVPMITKLTDAKKILSSTALQMLTQDIYASHVYQLALTSPGEKPLRSEYTCSPIIL